MDPLMEKYYPVSPYVYCGNNPVMFIDLDGRAWKPVQNADGRYTGFQWISPELSYTESGSLKAGLYEQGILFTDHGTFNPDNNYNMGSATATVYKADGTTADFDACVNPANPDIHATVPEGMYIAVPWMHQKKYRALQLRILNGSNRIPLGMKHPGDPSRDFASGINLHIAGSNNLTGKYTREKGGQKIERYVSEGCFLIDYNNWDTFINLFPKDTKNPTGVILYKYDPVEEERKRRKREEEERKKLQIQFLPPIPWPNQK